MARTPAHAAPPALPARGATSLRPGETPRLLGGFKIEVDEDGWRH
jgi:hypothetical protein